MNTDVGRTGVAPIVMNGSLMDSIEVLSEFMSMLTSPKNTDNVGLLLGRLVGMIEEFTDERKYSTVPGYKAISCVGMYLRTRFTKSHTVIVESKVVDLVLDICLHKPEVVRDSTREVMTLLSAILWFTPLHVVVLDSGALWAILDLWRDHELSRKEFLLLPIRTLLDRSLKFPDHERFCQSLMVEHCILGLLREVLCDFVSCGEVCELVMLILSMLYNSDRLTVKSLISTDFVQILKNVGDREHKTSDCLESLRRIVYQLENFVPSPAQQSVKEYLSQNFKKHCPLELGEDVVNLICQYAVEGYRCGQQVDFLNDQLLWYAAEVVSVCEVSCRVQVRPVGWLWCISPWISVPSHRLSPAFFHTGEICDDNPSSQTIFSVGECQGLVSSESCFGTPSDEVLETLLDRTMDKQQIINQLRLLNKDNLKPFL
eukprot:TRINITY_DN3243_c0_g1_i4.p1 TRINITY_DN3243_c0_g1~~TRINITY_DN3243_c0_g1_i4.p1  ORF type:complete len:486 (+),score=97.23 TRINITY_DN3243_c0_g1_i4:173-1459(+)